MKRSRIAASLNICILLVVAVARSQTSSGVMGTIRGIVLDSESKPLPEASVYVLPAEHMDRPIPATADKAGRFELRNIPSGDAYVSAYKESDGYPYNFFSFFILPGDRVPIKVHINSSSAQEVVLQMGLRAAYLDLSITDEAGRPLKQSAQLVFTRGDMPGEYRTSAMDAAHVMVPPVSFRLRIEAENYQPSGTLSMNPKTGEKLNASVALKRSPSQHP